MSKRLICLKAPCVGIVINSLCANRADADILLSDRRANGESFDGERVYSATEQEYHEVHRTNREFSCTCVVCQGRT